ncbi:MAG: ATP-binding cassette domain-containing protein [Ignavibacteria bacterium]|nr:ATP-binding cassette domain-containing protein [Ignavibacteria bacterium]
MPSLPNFAVNIIDLSHAYGDYLAVDKISFDIPKGQVFGLIGPNGAGKSTTIKMLTTLLPVTYGNAYLNGLSLVEQPEEIRKTIGYVPQLVSADGDLTAYENLLLSARLHGLSKIERVTRIKEILNALDLSESKDQLVSRFSGGMIRRLELAQALLHRPSILFLDEPTVGLDPAAKKMLWNIIHQIKKESELTILMTTHDMEEADKLCDTVALMFKGKIILKDSPSELKATIGPKSTLDDVFILHTGNSLKENGNYTDVRQVRTTISQL